MIFNKEVFPCLGDKNVEEITENDFIITEIDFSNQNVPKQAHIEVETPHLAPQPIIDDENLTNIQDIESGYDLQNYQLARDKERRQIRPPLWYQIADYVVAQLELDSFDKEPKSHEKVVASRDSVKWLAIMQDEMSSLCKNKTWNLVEKSQDCQPIDKIKKCERKTSDRRYKTRLIAKEFTQRECMITQKYFHLQ